jgi:hypothetical protein
MSTPETGFTCYTSVFGDYEPIWPPHQPDSAVDYVLVSDTTTPNRGWIHRKINPSDFDSPRLANRFQKMRFHESLPIGHLSVYIDANIRPVASLLPLLETFDASGADIGLYRHYSRHSVRSEAKACLKRNKVEHPEAVLPELGFYESQGFPDDDGLWEGSIIVKRHNSRKLDAAMAEWWELYSRFQTRDQFSLPYIIWKHGLHVCDLGQDPVGLPKPFVHLQHAHKSPRHRLARYLQARAPENGFWWNLQRVARSLAKI